MPLPTLPSAIDLSPFCSERDPPSYNSLPPISSLSLSLSSSFPPRNRLYLRSEGASPSVQRIIYTRVVFPVIISNSAQKSSHLCTAWCDARRARAALWLRYYQPNEFFKNRRGSSLFQWSFFPSRALFLCAVLFFYYTGRRYVRHFAMTWLNRAVSAEMKNTDPILWCYYWNLRFTVLIHTLREIHKISSPRWIKT